MDESGILLGQDWRAEVAQALATCRVLVPLYSPRYFTREECGREWHAFEQRILDHRARHSGNPTPIVPAIWTPVDTADMPHAVRRLQLHHESLGAEYSDEGIYTLIKNSLYERAYVTAVQALARAVISAADASRLRPCRVSDFGPLRNAFEEPERAAPADRRLVVALAAPTVRALPDGRSAGYYGTSAQDWNPFHPSSHQALGDFAAAVARHLSYEPVQISFEDDFESLTGGGADNGLGVLLVDAWAAQDPAIAGKLSRFDAMDLSWVGTMVPWNRDDLQTMQQGERLRRGLRDLLPRRLGDIWVPAPGGPRVQTLEQFRSLLPEVIRRALSGYLNHADAYPPPGSAGPRPQLSRPPLDGPGVSGPAEWLEDPRRTR